MYLIERRGKYRLVGENGTILMICSNPLICKHFAKELVNERVNPRQKGVPGKQKKDGLVSSADDGSGDSSHDNSTIKNGSSR